MLPKLVKILSMKESVSCFAPKLGNKSWGLCQRAQLLSRRQGENDSQQTDRVLTSHVLLLAREGEHNYKITNVFRAIFTRGLIAPPSFDPLIHFVPF